MLLKCNSVHYDVQFFPFSKMFLSLQSPCWLPISEPSSKLVIGGGVHHRPPPGCSHRLRDICIHKHIHTPSQAKQKQWLCFTPCKLCLGGFINCDLCTPAFPIYPDTILSLPLWMVIVPVGSWSSPTFAVVYNTRGYYDHSMNEVLSIRH